MFPKILEFKYISKYLNFHEIFKKINHLILTSSRVQGALSTTESEGSCYDTRRLSTNCQGEETGLVNSASVQT